MTRKKAPKIRIGIKAGGGLPALAYNHNQTAKKVRIRTTVKAGGGLPALVANHNAPRVRA